MVDQVQLAIQESKPSEDITDTGETVRGSEDTIDAVHDVVGIPAAIPGT